MRWTLLFVALILVLVELGEAARRTYNCPRLKIRNGKVKYGKQGRHVYFRCSRGFTVVGERYASCLTNNKWTKQPPVCASRGCRKITTSRGLRVRRLSRGVQLKFQCRNGLTRVGPESIYCNGRTWSGDIPKCVVVFSMGCNFDNRSLCGWTNDIDDDFDWTLGRGQTPTAFTGPSADHTTTNGLYLFIESSSPQYNGDKARLMSPRYTPKQLKGICFEFFYHMFGPDDPGEVGSLDLYMSPLATPINRTSQRLFHKVGNQGDIWHRADVDIPKTKKPVQFIIEATRMRGWSSDIAIDDIRLYNCSERPQTTTIPLSTSSLTNTTEPRPTAPFVIMPITSTIATAPTATTQTKTTPITTITTPTTTTTTPTTATTTTTTPTTTTTTPTTTRTTPTTTTATPTTTTTTPTTTTTTPTTTTTTPTTTTTTPTTTTTTPTTTTTTPTTTTTTPTTTTSTKTTTTPTTITSTTSTATTTTTTKTTTRPPPPPSTITTTSTTTPTTTLMLQASVSMKDTFIAALSTTSTTTANLVTTYSAGDGDSNRTADKDDSDYNNDDYNDDYDDDDDNNDLDDEDDDDDYDDYDSPDYDDAVTTQMVPRTTAPHTNNGDKSNTQSPSVKTTNIINNNSSNDTTSNKIADPPNSDDDDNYDTGEVREQGGGGKESSSSWQQIPLIVGVVAAVFVVAVIIAVVAYKASRRQKRKHKEEDDQMNIINEYVETNFNTL